MSSGIPNISIPLYEFNSSRVSVPISLSYHAGGIRVTDRAATLGLGWTLVAGGAITRAVVGLPDEESYGFFKWDYPADLSENYSGFYYEHFDENVSLSEISCFVNRVNNTGANNGQNYDHSPDNYYYNAQGLSGQFSYSTDKTLHTFPYDPLKIQNNLKSNQAVDKAPFIITASDGVIYEFGKPYVNGKTPATDYVSVDNSPSYASAWYLTKIISADKSDTVTFHYSIQADSYLNTNVISTMRAGFLAYSLGGLFRLEPKVTKSQSSSVEYNVRLLDIIGKNGRVHFNYGEETINSYRYGDTNYTHPSTIKPLSSIEVYAGIASEVKIKQFNLYHSFFNSVPVHSPNSLRLDSIAEIGFSEGSPHSNPPHIFSYATDDVPPYNTNSRDLWGYYNAYTSYGDNDNMLLVDVPVPLREEDGTYREPEENFQKRTVNPTVLDKGMLKRILYPTGGYTDFTFEANGKSKSVSVQVPQSNNQMIRTMDFWPGSGTGGIDKEFTPGLGGYNRKLNFYGRIVTYGQTYLENYPRVILEDVTANEIIIDKTLSALSSGAKPSESYSVPLSDINPLHTYRLYFPMPSDQILNGQTVRYELYAFYTEELPPITSNQEQFIYAGGLRIKSIEHKDNFRSSFIKKKYNYIESYWNSDAFTGNFNSIKAAFVKRLVLAPQQDDNVSGYNIRVTPLPASDIYMESPTYSIGSPSSSVSYSKVEEIQLTADDEVMGKTEYTFNEGIDMVTTGIARGINWRQHVKIDRSFIRSQLLNKRVYKKSYENDWVLIQETLNTYNNINDLPFDTKGSEYIKKYVSAYLFDDDQWGGTQILPGGPGSDPLCPMYSAATPISFNTMYLNIVRPTLVSTKTREMGSSGNWIEKQRDYEYLNLSHMKPGEITSTNSDGSKIKQQIRYSTDVTIPYEGQGNAGSQTPIVIPANEPVYSGIINLQLANITTPIETTTFIQHKDSANDYVLNSTFNYYNPLLPVIDSIAAIELSVPSAQFVSANLFETIVDYKIDNLILDNKYETIVDFRYDSNGSLVQQHKTNDVYETFLWGYHSQYPIAHIIGAKYDVVKNVIDQSLLADTQSYSDNDIRTGLNALRTDPSIKDALTYTYTFAPLRGMTSKTDPGGRVNYYEYDSHSRLSLIRDGSLNIVKKYDYNYNPSKETYLFQNAPKNVNYIKDDCPTGYWGESVTYKIPGGKYTSIISQADADQQAEAEANLLGQTYANENGNCSELPPPTVYTNKEVTMAFEKDDCPEGLFPVEDPYVYTVDAGQFTSLISELDADEKAMFDLFNSGQAYANSHGSCSSEPATIELISGTNVNARLAILDVNEFESEIGSLQFPSTSSADSEIIELPANSEGYILRFVVPLAPPYTDPYSNGPYRFNLQSEGLVWRSIPYTGSSNTTIFTQTDILKLRPGRTYTIKANRSIN